MSWFDDDRLPNNKPDMTEAERRADNLLGLIDVAVQNLIVEWGQDFTTENVSAARRAVLDQLGITPQRTVMFRGGRAYRDTEVTSDVRAAAAADRDAYASLRRRDDGTPALYDRSRSAMLQHANRILTAYSTEGRSNEELRAAHALVGSALRAAFPDGTAAVRAYAKAHRAAYRAVGAL